MKSYEILPAGMTGSGGCGSKGPKSYEILPGAGTAAQGLGGWTKGGGCGCGGSCGSLLGAQTVQPDLQSSGIADRATALPSIMPIYDDPFGRFDPVAIARAGLGNFSLQVIRDICRAAASELIRLLIRRDRLRHIVEWLNGIVEHIRYDDGNGIDYGDFCRLMFFTHGEYGRRANAATVSGDPETATHLNEAMEAMIPLLQGCGVGTSGENYRRYLALSTQVASTANGLMKELLEMQDKIEELRRALSRCPGGSPL